MHPSKIAHFLASSAFDTRNTFTALVEGTCADKRISKDVDSFSNITGLVIYFAADYRLYLLFQPQS